MTAGSGQGFQALRLSPLPQVDGGLTLVSRSATLPLPHGRRQAKGLTVTTLFTSPANQLLATDEAATCAKEPTAKARCRSRDHRLIALPCGLVDDIRVAQCDSALNTLCYLCVSFPYPPYGQHFQSMYGMVLVQLNFGDIMTPFARKQRLQAPQATCLIRK